VSIEHPKQQEGGKENEVRAQWCRQTLLTRALTLKTHSYIQHLFLLSYHGPKFTKRERLCMFIHSERRGGGIKCLSLALMLWDSSDHFLFYHGSSDVSFTCWGRRKARGSCRKRRLLATKSSGPCHRGL